VGLLGFLIFQVKICKLVAITS